MRRLLLTLAVVVVAVTACQKDVTCNEAPNEAAAVIENVSPFAVSQEEAIERLETVLATIDGEETRSNVKLIKSITPIEYADIVAKTRANEEYDIDNLLYVVEFEDGQGSAILGADERVDSVFAVLDSSVITEDNFEAALNGNVDVLENYLAALIAEEAISQLSDGSLTLPNVPLIYTKVVTNTIFSEHNERYLRLKWHQSSPFNKYCIDNNGNVCDTGDVAIAAAQLLADVIVRPVIGDGHAYITIGNQRFDLTLLKSKLPHVLYLEPLKSQIDEEVARYVKAVADELDILYLNGTPFETLNSIVNLLNTQLFDNVEMVNNVDFLTNVREQLYERSLPAFVKGVDLNGAGSHVWIMDGYFYEKYSKVIETYENGVLIDSEFIGYTSSEMVHCNFGFGGHCDGYYSFGAFNLSTEVVDERLVVDIVDIPSSRPYHFDDLQMITYSL